MEGQLLQHQVPPGSALLSVLEVGFFWKGLHAVAHVAKVARQVVAAVTAHNIKLTTKREFSFYAHRLTSSEYDWWKGLTSTEKVSEIQRLRVEEAGPWTPLYPMSAQLQSRLDDPATKARCKDALQNY